MKPKENKSTPRRRLARGKKPADNTNVEVSGGANLEAEDIQINGDVVGRDKLVAGDDIVMGEQDIVVESGAVVEKGAIVVGQGARLKQVIVDLPRSVQILIGVAAAAIVVIPVVLIASRPAPPTLNTEFILDASASMSDPERWANAQKVFSDNANRPFLDERTALRVIDGCTVPDHPQVSFAANQADRLAAVVNGLQPTGDAAMVDSIWHAANDLRALGPEATNRIILIGAGQDTCVVKQNRNPCDKMSDQVGDLERAGIQFELYIVALQQDEETLQELTCLADVNVNAKVYQADSYDSLQRILKEIHSSAGAANHGFEVGRTDGWTSDHPIEVVGIDYLRTPAVGKFAAQLQNGDALEQTMSVPHIDQPKLMVWYQSPYGNAHNALNIYVDGRPAFSDHSPSERAGKPVAAQAPDWSVAEVDMSGYSGQPVKVRVEYAQAAAQVGSLHLAALQQADVLWIDNIQITDGVVLAAIKATSTPSPTPFPTPTPTPSETVIGEVGQIANALTDAPQTIILSRRYTDPVVFAQPISYNGGDTAVARITSVQSDRFTLYIQEAPDRDGPHTASETVSYIVLEAGTWNLADGTLLEVGKLNTPATVGQKITGQWQTHNFTSVFRAAPVVLSQVQTANDPSWVSTRQRNTTVTGFDVALEREEAATAPHGAETIGWLAIEPGYGSWGRHAYEAVFTVDAVTDSGYAIRFGQSFDVAPRWVASLATYAGPDSAHLRYRNLTARGVEVFVEEDTTNDSETNHASEVVSYLAIEGDGVLTIGSREPVPARTPFHTPMPTATFTPVPPTNTPTPTPIPCNQAAFISDVTIPDGTVFNPDQSFVKTWRVKNEGTCQWGAGYQLIYVSGDRMSGQTVNLPKVAPGQDIDISVNLRAPGAAGEYTGNWQLRASNDETFRPLSVVIDVVAPPTPTPTPTSPPPVPGTQPPPPPNSGPTLTSPLVSPKQFYAGNCGWSPYQVKITVWASDSDGVASVPIYFRLADKDSRRTTDWTSLSMSLTPDGFLGPAWTRTISGLDIPVFSYREAWLQFYFVATDTRRAQTQSQTYGNIITVTYCEVPK